ncbi:MAG TPA: hypothetical protein VMB50_25005 [Myxococcales bacterium]|nr:hypothetical protein [Myxococcales bacterium]
MSAGLRSRWALLAVAATTALAAFYARGVSVDSGVLDYLPDDVPAVREWRASLQRFDAFDSWLVGLEEPGASLSVDGLRHVDAVTRSLEALKSSGVLAVRSVTNVETLREAADGSIDSNLLVTALPTDASGLDALKRRIVADREVYGALVSRDLKGYALVVRADPRKDPAALARLIERTVQAGRGPLGAHYLGAPFFAAVPLQHVVARLPWILPLFLLLLGGIFLAGTRRPGRVVLVLGGAGLSLVWWLALMRGLGRSVSPSSAPLALGWFALAGTLLAGLGDRSTRPLAWPRPGRVLLCLAAVAAGAVLLAHARPLSTPGEVFSAHDEVGRSLAFFDDRFGGSDFLQIDFKGDLTDPAVAARLLRLSDLLEGSRGFADVRSVAQLLAFLNHGFGDVSRVPTSRAALANLWFFLEGNGDVRNLVTDRHDEAMVMVRIPSRPPEGTAALVAAANAAVAGSALQGVAATAERLQAIARTSGLDLEPTRVSAVLAAATRAPSPPENAAIGAQVVSRLRSILASPDSPYQPSEDDWRGLAPVLADGSGDVAGRIRTAAAAMPGLGATGLAPKFVDMVVARERDLRLSVRSQRLAEGLVPSWSAAPEAFRQRAAGAVADLIDPQREGGSATIVVSGLQVVAGAIGASTLSHLWRDLVWILGLGVLSLFFGLRRGVLGLLVAATATALTLIGCRAAGVELDAGSATFYLLPALLGVCTWPSRRGSRSFLLALGAAMATLLFTGAPPVTRVAAVAFAGLVSVALVAWFLGSRGEPTA